MSGPSTQPDPIGLAGGLNLYGYAGGDPVNFSDPFGLCVDKDVNCENLVRMLRAQRGSEFQAAADRYDAQTTGRVHFYSRELNTSRWDAHNVDGDPKTFSLGNTRGAGGDVFLRGDVSTEDFLLTAVHESIHLAGSRSEGAAWHAAWNAYNQLSPRGQGAAMWNAAAFNQMWGGGFGRPLPASTTEPQTPQRPYNP